jgi:predicted nucleic acid-binding protein
MILVDTSVWIGYLHSGQPGLAQLLQNGAVLAHPFVTGELALGSLRNRDTVLGLLDALPQAIAAGDDEVRQLTEEQSLFSIGIGYVDAHLLAATRLTPDARLWTSDKRLASAAARLKLAFATP